MTGSIRVLWGAGLCAALLLGVLQDGWAASWEPYSVCTCSGECICVPNAQGYGYFATQWRQWPAEPRPNVDFPRSIGAEVIPTPAGQRQPAPSAIGPVPSVGPTEETMLPLPPPEVELPRMDFPLLPEPRIEVPQRTAPPQEMPAEAPSAVTPGTPPAETPVETPVEAPPDTPVETPTDTPGEAPGDTRIHSPTEAPEDAIVVGPFLQSGRAALAEEPRQAPPLSGASWLGSATGRLFGAQYAALPEVQADDVQSTASATLSESPGPAPQSPEAANTSGPTLAASGIPESQARPGSFQPKALQANWTAALNPGLRGDMGGPIPVYPPVERPQPAVHYAEASPQATPTVPRQPIEQPKTQPSDELPSAQYVRGAPVALDGFCPVELGENERWLLGDSRWSVVYQGCTYVFRGPTQRQRFLADPRRYAPACSAQDPVLAVEENRRVAGLTDHCVVYDGQLYMFSSSATLARFKENPRRYAADARR